MVKYVLLAAVVLLVVQLTVVGFFYPEKQLRQLFEQEQSSLSDDLSVTEQRLLAEFATMAEESIIHRSGLGPGIRQLFVPSQEQLRRSGQLSTMGKAWFEQISGRFTLLSCLFYEYMLRWGVFFIRFEFVLMILSGAVISGYLKRKIRQSAFGITTSVRQRLSLRALLAWLYLCVLLNFSPLPFSMVQAWTELIVGAWLLCSCVANLQKRI